MTLQQYSAWPSVSTEAKQAFNVAHGHALNSKAISIHEKETILRFRSHQRWGNWVWQEQSGIELTAVMTQEVKEANQIMVTIFTLSVFQRKGTAFTRQKSDNDESDDFLGYIIRWICNIFSPLPHQV